jgi:glutathione synthetase
MNLANRLIRRQEYDRIGRESRLRLEMSRAIKCPSILSHLTTFKKVQQQLSSLEALERFLPKANAENIVKTFAPIHSMDESLAGLHARKLATDAKTARNYVLKPSLEGGGNNIYGEDIPKFLTEIPLESWSSYILMEKIIPPVLHNILMSHRGIHEGPVISELGIFGVCLWRRKAKVNLEAGGGGNQAEILESFAPSWSFKTKDAGVNEMSVVKGYGCFDSPALVDWEVFSTVSLT